MKERMFLIVSIIIFELSVLFYLSVYDKHFKIGISSDEIVIKNNDIEKNMDSITKNDESYQRDYRKDIYTLKEEQLMRDEYNKNTKIKKNTTDNKEVFKMDTEIIVKNLTSKEIRDILKLSKSLNIKEFLQMKDYLFESNREKALLEAINLLQSALTEDEYEEAKRIADRFIYVDVAEEMAKNTSNLN